MSLFRELKRRNVFRVAALYVVAAWVLLQLVDLAIGAAGGPLWPLWVLMGLLAVGLLVSLWVAWTFELTPRGLQRDDTVEPSASFRRQTANRLNLITLSLLLIAIGLVLVDYAIDDEKVPVVDAHLQPYLSDELEERAERSRRAQEAAKDKGAADENADDPGDR